MRTLIDQEAHVLNLRYCDLTKEEVRIAEQLVPRRLLDVEIIDDNGEPCHLYNTTPLGKLALACYRAAKTSISV